DAAPLAFSTLRRLTLRRSPCAGSCSRPSPLVFCKPTPFLAPPQLPRPPHGLALRRTHHGLPADRRRGCLLLRPVVVRPAAPPFDHAQPTCPGGGPRRVGRAGQKEAAGLDGHPAREGGEGRTGTASLETRHPQPNLAGRLPDRATAGANVLRPRPRRGDA